MEGWRTYTPDGRMLEVERDGLEWVARCDGTRGAGASAREAITEALGSGGVSIDPAEPDLKAWIAEAAARIEAEAG